MSLRESPKNYTITIMDLVRKNTSSDKEMITKKKRLLNH